MSDVSLHRRGGDANDAQAVVRGDLILPRTGNWTAHLELEREAMAGPVVLRWLGTDLQGYVLSGGEHEGRYQALIVGGAGGLWKELPAKGHVNQAQARAIVEAILREAGEQLAVDADTAVLAQAVPAWVRMAGAAGEALDLITQTIGAIWRIRPDGRVWIGQDRWTEQAPADILEGDPAQETAELAPEQLAPLPGQVLQGRRVGVVRFVIEPDSHRARLWYQAAGEAPHDPLKAGFYQLAREALRGVDYLAAYPCKVRVQRSDGTLDVEPDSQRIPPMTGVRYRGPCQGAKLSVAPNTRALLGFEGGDPRYPFISLWDMGDGDKSVARVDDQVNCGTLTLVVTGGAMAPAVLSGSYQSPLGGDPLVIASGVAIPLRGKIITGSPHIALKAGLVLS